MLSLLLLSSSPIQAQAGSESWMGQAWNQCAAALTSWGFGSAAQEQRLKQASWHLEEALKISNHLNLALSPESNTSLEGPRMMVLHGAIHEHFHQARTLSKKTSQLPSRPSFLEVQHQLDKTFALVELERLLQYHHGLTLSGVDSTTFEWIQEQLEQDTVSQQELADQLAQTKALLTLDHSMTERLHSLNSVLLLSGLSFSSLKELLDFFPEALPQVENPHFVRALAERVFAPQKHSHTEEEEDDSFYDRNLLYLYYTSARKLRVSADQARKEGLNDLHHLELELFERGSKKQQEIEDMLLAIQEQLSP